MRAPHAHRGFIRAYDSAGDGFDRPDSDAVRCILSAARCHWHLSTEWNGFWPDIGDGETNETEMIKRAVADVADRMMV